MSTEMPMVRANWTRMTLEFWKKNLAREDLERTLDAIGDATTRLLEECGPLEWLPVDTYIRVAVAPARLVGAPELRNLSRRLTLDSFGKPIFRAAVEGALQLFHKTPGDLARIVPRGWSLVGRGTGELTVKSVAPRLTTITWSQIPAIVRAAPELATTWLGAIDAFYDLAAHHGKTEMDASDFARGRVVYTMRW